jgi:hypothetical protein
MFSKSNPESKKNNQPEVEDLIIPKSNPDARKIMTESEQQQPELIKLVEKISGILSPYFVVIVGLYLYEDNFFFGTILVLTGILSLLKVSYEDIWLWIDKVKGFWQNNQPK